MSDPTSLTISINRTGMSGSPAPFVCAGNDTTRDLSVTSYREPALAPRITYAPVGDSHGDVPLGWSYQETILAFNVFDEGSTTEDQMRVKIALLAAALARLSYEVTVTVNGAHAETWTCRPGTVTAADDRTSTDLRNHRPVWSVAIPAYPVRSVAS